MNEREKVLLHNEATLAAILLDPRYKVMLTESEKEIAKKYINQAWYVLKKSRIQSCF